MDSECSSTLLYSHKAALLLLSLLLSKLLLCTSQGSHRCRQAGSIAGRTEFQSRHPSQRLEIWWDFVSPLWPLWYANICSWCLTKHALPRVLELLQHSGAHLPWCLQGSLSAVEAGAGRAGAFFQVGASAKPAGDAGETELRRLQQEVGLTLTAVGFFAACDGTVQPFLTAISISFMRGLMYRLNQLYWHFCYPCLRWCWVSQWAILGPSCHPMRQPR